MCNINWQCRSNHNTTLAASSELHAEASIAVAAGEAMRQLLLLSLGLIISGVEGLGGDVETMQLAGTVRAYGAAA